MELQAKIGKVVSVSDWQKWGSCFAENGLFVLLEVNGDTDHPAYKIGKEILDELLTVFTNFQNKDLSTVVKLLDNFKENSHITTIIIGLILGKTLYIAGKGQGVVLLVRKGKVGKIFSNCGTSMGGVQKEDALFFFSETFGQVLDDEKKNQILTVNDPKDLEEKITPLLSAFGIKGAAILTACLSEKAREKRFISEVINFRYGGREKIIGFWQKLKDIIANRKVDIHETAEEKKSKRTLLTIAVILIVMLTLSIFLNINHTSKSQKNKKLSEVMDLVTHQYDEAVSLLELNSVRSRQLLSDSKLSLSPLLKEFPKNSKEYKETSEWLSKISSQEVIAYKIYKLTGVPLFFDISLIKQGGEGIKIAGFEENKAILDIKNKTLYRLSTVTKQAEIIGGSDVVKDAQSVDIHGKNIYILNSDGILEVNTDSKTGRVVIKNDEKWGDISGLASFGGNIYLLDRKNNAIWKYMKTDIGFSQRYSYLNPDVRVNFSASSKMIIDGDVWVLTGDNILKFSKGLRAEFVFKDFADTLQNIVSIATSERYLYVLDKSLSRIVVFDKDDNYQSQYQWDGLKDANDMVVSEEEKKIFVLSASKIYAIDIK